jgi:hypothetical protein
MGGHLGWSLGEHAPPSSRSRPPYTPALALVARCVTSDDDPIGQLVPDDNIHNYTDATHVIMKIARDPITCAFGPPYENGRVAPELRSP